jgi:hypothetical protein
MKEAVQNLRQYVPSQQSDQKAMTQHMREVTQRDTKERGDTCDEETMPLRGCEWEEGND